MTDSKEKILDFKTLPELRSEEVQEVLGWIPPWILRSGITVLFFIVIVLFVGSWFYKYPDVLEAPLVATSHHPPVHVNARASGKISQLMVADKQQVKSSDYLAVIENPANINDINELRKQLAKWQEMMREGNFTFTSDELNRKYELGDMQTSYLGFIRSAVSYHQFVELNYFPQRISAIEEQIASQKQFYERLLTQYEVTRQQYAVAQRQYARDSILNHQRMISDAEHDLSLISFLNNRQSLESSRIALDNANMQIEQSLQSILDMKLQEQDRLGQLQTEVNTGFNNLQNSFSTWEMTYVLKTPIDGSVDFSKFWNVHQNIIAGESVFTIISEDSGQLIGRAALPIAGSGKVKTGQTVNVRFLNFPDVEYGIIRGVVSNISIVPSGDSYTLEIDFLNGLTTTYGIELPFHQEMHAIAEIITDDLRLLERLFMPLKKIFSE